MKYKWFIFGCTFYGPSGSLKVPYCVCVFYSFKIVCVFFIISIIIILFLSVLLVHEKHGKIDASEVAIQLLVVTLRKIYMRTQAVCKTSKYWKMTIKCLNSQQRLLFAHPSNDRYNSGTKTNAGRCSSGNDLLLLSITLKIAVFSRTYI